MERSAREEPGEALETGARGQPCGQPKSIPTLGPAAGQFARRRASASPPQDPGAGVQSFAFGGVGPSPASSFQGVRLREGECLHLPGTRGLGGTGPRTLLSLGGDFRAGEVSADFTSQPEWKHVVSVVSATVAHRPFRN